MQKQLTKQTLKIFWDHAKKYRWQLIIVMVTTLVVPIIQSYTPILYRDLINTLAKGRVEGIFETAVHIIILILAVNLISQALRRVLSFASNFFQLSVMRDLTNTCYATLHKHSFGFFSSNFVGSLVTKVKRYERAFERIADQIIYELGRALLYVIIIVVVLLLNYPILGFILLAWTVVFSLFSYLFTLYKLPHDIRQAEADTRATGQLADSITNNINIKLFANYNLETNRFNDVITNQFKLRRKSWTLGNVSDLIQALLMIGLESIMLYFALKLWKEGSLQIGDIALLQAYIIRIMEQLWNTAKNTKNIFEAIADANEMTEILIRPQEVTDVPGAKSLVIDKGQIDFKSAAFGYHEDADVLNDFNMTIKAGERVAFVGPSGGGKSTIVKLLFRLYDVDGGEILVDGQNIKNVSQNSLHQALALVPQDPILFHRSLIENIRYAKPNATDEEVIAVAKLAHVHEFATSFPQGYETYVGERGIKLSGGERQRVAIARALLKNAPILVLDEATSSLDSESEMFIQDALTKLMHGRTTIVVAHRLSTIMQMDRILVIDGGKIIEEGKHEELLKVKKGVYHKLWEIQAGGFTKE